MKAKHVMVSPVKVGRAEMTVREVAKMLTDNGISALPIIDEKGRLIGIVSEGDLIRRAEIGTQKHRSWWLSLFTSNIQLAEEYSRAHSRLIKDLMTNEVVTVDPETPLEKVAELFERHRIKRVPVCENGGLVGIVTRANLVQAIATAPQKAHSDLGDEQIRERARKRIESESWANTSSINITVKDGTVHLWGTVHSEAERNALRVAVENIAGVKEIKDNIVLEPFPVWM
ncbi:MAG: CBS domain-containing protein [Xanthobacteraceae bacterium]|nr:CBS domain-containing protein [Xanthobacteraceae bacterium]